MSTRIFVSHHHHNHHHHQHQGLDHLIRSVSRVRDALANVSSVFQMFSFPVVYSGTISNGFGFVVFFANVEASSVCIRLSCIICLRSIVRGVCSRLFCGHKGYSLPEVTITSFLPPQFFVFVRLLESYFLTHIKMVRSASKSDFLSSSLMIPGQCSCSCCREEQMKASPRCLKTEIFG